MPSPPRHLGGYGGRPFFCLVGRLDLLGYGAVLLVIDNYDSFTYNLVQYLGELGVAMEIHRNDEIGLDDIRRLAPDRLLISPGPCTPREAGLSTEIIRAFPGDKGLDDFAQWIRTASAPGAEAERKKKLKKQDIAELDTLGRFKYAHRNARHRWKLNESFPSSRVVNAYLQPVMGQWRK